MKSILFLLFANAVIVHTAAAQKHSRKYDAAGDKINWPEAYHPTKTKFYVHNEIEINAPPERIWQILLDATRWPEWYVGARKVQVRNGNRLDANAVFDWQTMGLQFQSTVREFVPNERLSWESSKKQIQGYHAWLILPTEYGCKVITDESQKGWLTFFEKIFQPNKLMKLHDIWLWEIKRKAEESATPSR